MKSQTTLMKPTSGRVVELVPRGVLSILGKFMLAGAMLAAMLVFTIPLAVGLVYEWLKGGLEW